MRIPRPNGPGPLERSLLDFLTLVETPEHDLARTFLEGLYDSAGVNSINFDVEPKTLFDYAKIGFHNIPFASVLQQEEIDALLSKIEEADKILSFKYSKDKDWPYHSYNEMLTKENIWAKGDSDPEDMELDENLTKNTGQGSKRSFSEILTNPSKKTISKTLVPDFLKIETDTFNVVHSIEALTLNTISIPKNFDNCFKTIFRSFEAASSLVGTSTQTNDSISLETTSVVGYEFFSNPSKENYSRSATDEKWSKAVSIITDSFREFGEVSEGKTLGSQFIQNELVRAHAEYTHKEKINDRILKYNVSENTLTNALLVLYPSNPRATSWIPGALKLLCKKFVEKEDFRNILFDKLPFISNTITSMIDTGWNKVQVLKNTEDFKKRLAKNPKLKPKESDQKKVMIFHRALIDPTKGPTTKEERDQIGVFNSNLNKIAAYASEAYATTYDPVVRLHRINTGIVKLYSCAKYVTDAIIDRKQLIHKLLISKRSEKIANLTPEEKEANKMIKFTIEEWNEAITTYCSTSPMLNNALRMKFGSVDAHSVNWKQFAESIFA